MKKSIQSRRSKSRRTSPAIRSVEDLNTRKASDIALTRSYLFYGRSGTGKTTLASTFPKPILLLDVRDRGTDSIADIDGIDVLSVESWDDFETPYWYLKTKNKRKYKTLVIDTTSQLQQIVVEEIHLRKNKDVEGAGNWGSLKKGDWGEIVSRLKLWITYTRDLEMNVVFLAQERVFNIEDDEDEDDELSVEIGPGVSPALRSHLNANVSVIGQTHIRQRIIKVKKKKGREASEKEVTEYCLRIGPSAVYDTKVRKPKSIELPSVLVDPIYEDLMELITGDE